MTGRYPSHTGIGPAVIPPNAPYGMPKEETLLPQVLSAAGYRTAAIGKCPPPTRLAPLCARQRDPPRSAAGHLGFCDERFTPTFRGFDEFTGYLNGAEDYWSHYRCQAPASGGGEQAESVPPNPHGIVCSGVSSTLSAGANSSSTSKWNVSALCRLLAPIRLSADVLTPAVCCCQFLDFRNGSQVSALAPAENRSFEDYSAFVFAEEASRMASNHQAAHPTAPFFLCAPPRLLSERIRCRRHLRMVLRAGTWRCNLCTSRCRRLTRQLRSTPRRSLTSTGG